MSSASRVYVRIAFLISLLAAAPGISQAAQGDCAQPVTNGVGPAATDCLFILQVTVALRSCDQNPCVCDADGNGLVAATDALTCLRVATGAGGQLNCPCSNDCHSSQAPACGGECEFGGTCAPDPFFPDECECLSACEASAAPACGASCDDDEPGATCQSLNFTTPGGSPIDVCTCLPPGAQFCTDADTPDCEGVCTPGTLCEDAGGGNCACVAQPLQGSCTSATAPACGGTCPDGFICTDAGGGNCDCTVFTGQGETCFDADAPTCGGTCSFGEQCAIDFLGDCECFVPCEVGIAPACGGDCGSDGGTCVVRTVSFGGGSIDFCECVD